MHDAEEHLPSCVEPVQHLAPGAPVRVSAMPNSSATSSTCSRLPSVKADRKVCGMMSMQEADDAAAGFRLLLVLGDGAGIERGRVDVHARRRA